MRLSELKVSDEPFWGKYADMRRRYLKGSHPKIYKMLKDEGKLESHCKAIDERCQRYVDRYIEYASEHDESLPDRGTDPIGWTGHMNMYQHEAEEIVYHDILYIL